MSCRRGGSSPERKALRRRAGFTLLELLAVTLLLGLLSTYVVVNMDNLVPRSRLDKAARDLGEILTRLRGMAVFAGRTHYLEYDLEGERYRILRPSTIAERDDGAPDQVETNWFELPGRIRIEDVRFSERDVETRGMISVEFTPTGEVVGHLVTLVSDEIIHEIHGRFAIEMNPITGLVTYTPGGRNYNPVRSESEFRR